MAASTYFAQVQQLYIAYFGRPADTTGQAFWASAIDAANGNIAAVQAGFSSSAESQALYGNKSNIDKVTSIYVNTFGRQPDAAGLTFWVNQLETGKMTQAQAAWTIQQSAGPIDAAVVQAKLVAAQAFTAQIDTAAEIQGYQGAAAADSARAFLATVNSTATGLTAVAGAATAVATAVAVGGNAGATFTLTSGVDNLVGDGGNNTFIAGSQAGQATLTAGDQINGGAGTDTLKIFNDAANNTANFALATVTNVENVEATMSATGQKLDVSANADVKKATLVNGFDGEVTLGLAQQAGITGAVNTTGAAATFVFKNAAGLADTATLNLTGANTATSGVKIAAVETLNVVATGANVLGSFATDATKLVITGAGSVSATLTAASAAASVVKTIDASAATGNLTIDNKSAAAAIESIKTGSGNDTYTTLFASLAKDDVIDLGAGTDSLRFSDATLIDAAAKALLTGVAGVEQLGTVNAALTVDGDVVSQTSFYTDGADGKFVGTNLANNTALTFGAGAELASTAAMKLGANNALTVNLAGSETAASNAVAGLTVTGSTTVTVNSTGTVGVADNVLKLTAADNQSVVVTGAHNLTLTTANASNVTGFTIDGSAFTGKLTVTGTAAADIIKGGSGDDIIGGGAGADTLTGGAGKDLFVITGSVYGASKDVTTITDFVKGTDKLVSGAAVPTALTKVAVTELTLDLALGEIAAKAATDSTAAWGVFGGNTYVVAGGDADATLGATDVVVKLAGTVDLGTTVGDVFAVVA